jgi:hypothetical protein
MIIAFDLDDVLCTRPEGVEHLGHHKYLHCQPIQEMIDILNECYDRGDYIKIYTSRGMSVFKGDVSKIYGNLFESTNQQLKDWGIKYHELIMGKIHYNLLIDDKAINSTKISSLKDIDEWNT